MIASKETTTIEVHQVVAIHRDCIGLSILVDGLSVAILKDVFRPV